MLRPVGKFVALHVYPPVPPVAVKVTGPYATFSVALDSEVGAVILRAGLMVSDRGTVAEPPLESTTVNETL